MTLTLTLPPEKEAALKAAAQAQGVSAEQWLQHSAEQHLKSASRPASSQTRRPLSTRIREIWADLPEEPALIPGRRRLPDRPSRLRLA